MIQLPPRPPRPTVQPFIPGCLWSQACLPFAEGTAAPTAADKWVALAAEYIRERCSRGADAPIDVSHRDVHLAVAIQRDESIVHELEVLMFARVRRGRSRLTWEYRRLSSARGRSYFLTCQNSERSERIWSHISRMA